MKDVFQDRLANSHNKTQAFWLAETGLYARADRRYTVAWDGDEDGGTVYLFDNALSGLKQLIYTFTFRNSEAASAFASLMEEEVGSWEAEEFYLGRAGRRQAEPIRQRREREADARVFA